MTTTELTTTVRSLKEAMLMKAEVEAEIETLQDRIKEEMTARAVEVMVVDVHKVCWSKVVSNPKSRITYTQINKTM
jgi:hypothetical protein